MGGNLSSNTVLFQRPDLGSEVFQGILGDHQPLELDMSDLGRPTGTRRHHQMLGLGRLLQPSQLSGQFSRWHFSQCKDVTFLVGTHGNIMEQTCGNSRLSANGRAGLWAPFSPCFLSSAKKSQDGSLRKMRPSQTTTSLWLGRMPNRGCPNRGLYNTFERF